MKNSEVFWFNLDITYCDNTKCKYKSCRRNQKNYIKDTSPDATNLISIASFAGECDKYPTDNK